MSAGYSLGGYPMKNDDLIRAIMILAVVVLLLPIIGAVIQL